MKNLIVLNGKLYKLKAKDAKRLSLSAQTERIIERGNKTSRHTTEDTDSILYEIEQTYKPLGEINSIFNT